MKKKIQKAKKISITISENKAKMFVFGVFIFAFFFTFHDSFALINKEINYQGKLTDASGVVVTDGSYDMQLVVYDAVSGGNCLWTARGTCGTPTTRSVTVTDGIFNILLGDTGAGDNAIDLDFDGASYYLGVKIGTDSEMSPRKRIGAVPQAFNALNLKSDGYINITGTPTASTVGGGTVYINPGTSTADYTLLGVAVGGTQKLKLDAEGDLSISGNLSLDSGSITSGTWNGDIIGVDYGGTGIDTSASTGIPTISSGTWSVASSLGVTLGGTGTTTQFTQGSIVFAGASGIYSQDNTNFFWDDANNRLGIGTATPSQSLHFASSSDSLIRFEKAGGSNSEGANSGGTFVEDTSVGTKSWNAYGNVSNVASSNDQYATFGSMPAATSYYLKATNFNFNIPTGSNIDGIEVVIERHGESGYVYDNIVKIVKGGTISGTDKADTVTVWPATDTTKTYGGSSDAWGLSWTADDINLSNFGVVISATADPYGFGFIDHITIKVYYSTPASNWVAGLDAGDGSFKISGSSDVGTNDYLTITAGGEIGLSTTSPTARLHLPAGTATASTAPLKLTAGTNLTTPEAGAIEFDGTNLYYTDSTLTRQTVGTGTGHDVVTLAGSYDYLTLSGQQITLNQLDLTTDVTGILGVANGGTGTSTAFTTGSLVFAGASGVYSQDNSNLFWDDTNNYLGIGTATPNSKLDVLDIAVTTGNILTLGQNTSAFSGDGINMNFASGSGTFTGDFLDFNYDGTNRFSLDYRGTATATPVNGYEGFVVNQYGDSRAYLAEMNASNVAQDGYHAYYVDIFNDVDGYGTAGAFAIYDSAVATTASTTNYFNIEHNTSTKSTDVFYANMANGSGSFSGNFLNFNNAGNQVLRVEDSGKINIERFYNLGSGSGLYSTMHDDYAGITSDLSSDSVSQLGVYAFESYIDGNGSYDIGGILNGQIYLPYGEINTTNIFNITQQSALGMNFSSDLFYANMNSNGSGSFTGDFLDFNVNSNSAFNVDASGATAINMRANYGMGSLLNLFDNGYQGDDGVLIYAVNTGGDGLIYNGDTATTVNNTMTFNHYDSAKTGDLLYANMAQNLGSFTGNFLNFNVKGGQYFRVASSGDTIINSSGSYALLLTDDNGMEGNLLDIQTYTNNQSISISDVGTSSSNTIQISHNSSAKTGDLLYANMADGSGTFTGNYLNFQKNGVESFRVDHRGTVRITPQDGYYGIYIDQLGDDDGIRSRMEAYDMAQNGTYAYHALIINDADNYGTGGGLSVVEIGNTGTLTTSNTLNVQHSGSEKSTDLFYANMANGTGSFTGDFLDFNVNSDHRFRVSAYGETFIDSAGSYGLYVTDANGMEGNGLIDLSSSGGNSGVYYAKSGPGGSAMWVSDTGSTGTNLFNIAHSTSAMTGDLFYANMANGSGSFTGNFLNFNNASSQVFKVQDNGKIRINQYADYSAQENYLYANDIAQTGYYAYKAHLYNDADLYGTGGALRIAEYGTAGTTVTTNYIDIYHQGSSKSTDVMHVSMLDDGTGSFTGDFLDFNVNSTQVFSVDSLGTVDINPSGDNDALEIYQNYNGVGMYMSTYGIVENHTSNMVDLVLGNNNGTYSNTGKVLAISDSSANGEVSGTGNYIDINQSGTLAKSTDVIYANMGAGTGSFTGNFLNFNNNSNQVLRVEDSGKINIERFYNLGSGSGLYSTMHDDYAGITSDLSGDSVSQLGVYAFESYIYGSGSYDIGGILNGQIYLPSGEINYTNVLNIEQDSALGVNFSSDLFYAGMARSGSGSFTGNFLNFNNGGSQKFKLDASGNVNLLGDITAGNQSVTGWNDFGVMEVLTDYATDTSGHFTAVQVRDSEATGAKGGTFVGLRARGTAASPTAVLANDALARFDGRGYDGTDWNTTGGARGGMEIHAAGNWSGTDNSTYIVFNTTATASAIAAERMRIDQNGYVGIGTATPGSYMLNVNGDIYGSSVSGEDMYVHNIYSSDSTASMILGSTAVSTTGHILPSVDDTYDLGSSTYRFRDLYLGPASLHLGVDGDEAVISYDTVNDKINFDKEIESSGLLSVSGTMNMGTTTAPGTPVAGDMYSDGTDLFFYNGLGWDDLTGSAVSGASGAVQFSNGSGFASDATNLFWDDTNDRLSIGVASPVAKLDVAGSVRTNNQFISTLATGTAPLAISSTTLVPNLNADLLDGYQSSMAAGSSTVVVRNASGYVYANYFNTTAAATATNASHFAIQTTSDGFIRWQTPAEARQSLALSSTDTVTFAGVNSINAPVSITNSRLSISNSTSGSIIIDTDGNGDWAGIGELSGGLALSSDASPETSPDVFITNANSVGIGTTNPGQKFVVWNGTTSGTYSLTGWTHSSDARLKTNVEPINDSLAKLMSLNGVYYNWISNPDVGRQIGFIAQEMKDVVPEVVIGDDAAGYGISYGNLSALIVGAVQEQQGIIEENEVEINVLRLGTDQNASTLSELQVSIDNELVTIGNELNTINTKIASISSAITSLEDSNANQEIRLATLEDQMAQIDAELINTQINELMDFMLAIESGRYIKLDELAAGDILLNGKIEADSMVAGAFSVKVSDEASATIGTSAICPVGTYYDSVNKTCETAIDADSDGRDDVSGESVSDGVSTSVYTSAVSANSKIFTAPKVSLDFSLATNNILEGESFSVEIKNPTTEKIEFDWWIVESVSSLQ